MPNNQTARPRWGCQPHPELDEMLKRAAQYKMTPAEMREQRISFVYGMLPFNSKLTKEDVRRHLEDIGM